MKENENYLKGSNKVGNYKYAPSVKGVYVIYHDITEQFYIGQTNDIGRRLSHHFGDLNRNIHHCERLQKVFNENNYDYFSFSYKQIDDDKERKRFEQEAINKFSSSEKFLNTTLEDETWINEKNTDKVIDWKAKLSKKASKRTGDKNPFFGKHHSDKTKQKLREKNIGTSNEDCWRAVVINGVKYENLTEASNIISITPGALVNRCNSKGKIFCNFYYYDTVGEIKIMDKEIMFDPSLKNVKSAFSIESKIYFSTSEICEEYGIKNSTVHYRIKSNNYKNWIKIA